MKARVYTRDGIEPAIKLSFASVVGFYGFGSLLGKKYFFIFKRRKVQSNPESENVKDLKGLSL